MSAPATAPTDRPPLAKCKPTPTQQEADDLLEAVQCALNDALADLRTLSHGLEDPHGFIGLAIARVTKANLEAWEAQREVRFPPTYECRWCGGSFERNAIYTVRDQDEDCSICAPCAEDHKLIADDSNRLGDGS